MKSSFLLFLFPAFLALLCLSCRTENSTKELYEKSGNRAKEISFSETKLAPNLAQSKSILIHPEGKTIQTRFSPPDGYERLVSPKPSFGSYLQNLPLQPHGAKVHYYNGEEKYNDVYEAVVKMDVGKRDLQQCADAVMRLRAEYLYGQKAYDEIHFNFTNGMQIDYQKWRDGYRVKVSGNKVSWVETSAKSDDYAAFRKYMDIIFSYAGTLSLAKELNPVSVENIEIGDVFIRGGSPGHAVVVVDVAVQEDTKERLFLLAQSYMPAQEIHVLKNPAQERGNPWYSNQIESQLFTPEWTFSKESLKRF